MPVMHIGLALAAVLWTAAAAADLYRWVDPETGSVKFSNYPPPWYGNEAKERRAPKVDRILERQRPPAMETEPAPLPIGTLTPGAVTASKPAAVQLGALETRRKQLLSQAAASIANPAQLQKLLEEYAQLLAEMDKKDPQGAPARRAEAEAALEKLPMGPSK